MKRAIGIALLALAACSDPLKDPSEVRGLRVLAVQLDPPLARPGETVSMKALVHDGRSPIDGPRPRTVLWITGCHDPADDAPGACYGRLGWLSSLSPEALAAPPDTAPEGFHLVWGDDATVTLPPDIVTNHAGLPGESTPIGLSYAFFLACAGRIVPSHLARPRMGIPLDCVDGAGEPVSADDYTLGYAAVRAHDTYRNTNPVLGATTFDGAASVGGACVVDTDCGDAHACAGGSCRRVLAACAKGERADCPAIDVRPDVRPESFEKDDLLTIGGDTATESLSAAYFATSGAFDEPVRAVRSSDGDHAGRLRLDPGFVGRVRVWAVVRDGRGGASWTEDEVVVR